MDIVDEIKREIARTELLNDMAEGMTEPRSTAALAAAINEIERLRKLLQQVLTDAHAQDVLLEWWHLLECETVPNDPA